MLPTTLLVAGAVFVALASGTNRCTNEADIELYDKNNHSKFICWPVPKCNDGQESSVQPGSSHPKAGTKVQCVPCPMDFFSNNSTKRRCRKCMSCGNRNELLPCEHSSNRQCSNTCISNAYYFNATDQQCHPCTECCGASDENIEPQCILLTKGTVIGGKGEKHCKAFSNSIEPCDDLPSGGVEKKEPKGNLSSVLCGNSSLSNKSSAVEKDCEQRLDRVCIGLVCALGFMTVVSPVLVCVAYLYGKRKGRLRSGYSPSSEHSSCIHSWFTGSSTCAGQGCGGSEMVPCLNFCQEKIKLIPDGTNIDNLPYEVEDQLIQKLDAKRPHTKNWWDVGRKIGLSNSTLESVKREDDREDGSPTKCLLRILSSQENVISLRKLVEIIHSLGRHDICSAVSEWYLSQANTA